MTPRIKTIIGTVAWLAIIAIPCHAIEGLRLTIDGTNVVLGWPSISNETYIVQYRPTFSVGDPWQVLTNSYPAETGTNWTRFIHTGQVQLPIQSGGGGNGGGGSPPPFLLPSQLLPSDEETIVPLPTFPPLPQFPPLPWENQNHGSLRNFLSFRSGGAGANAESSGPNVSSGFYQVVRTGVHVVGLTNGSILGGTVILPLEYGSTSPEGLSSIAVTLDATNSPPGFYVPFPTNGFLQAVWNTQKITNGTYQFQVSTELTYAVGVSDSTSPTVTVSNAISIPNFLEICGTNMWAEAQTIYTNGVARLDLYNDTGNYIGSLQTAIDQSGYVVFWIDLTDNNGQPLPYSFYDVIITAGPNSASLSAAAAASAAGNSAANRVFYESLYLYTTKAVIAYQPLFNTENNATLLREMVETVVAVMHGPHPIVPTADQPSLLASVSNWTDFTNYLATPEVHDLYYFGHGWLVGIGFTNAGLNMTVPQIKSLLGNANSLAGTNRHGYRYVFLDGCQTAGGDWCTAFGIPKIQNMPLTYFQVNKVRPRAYMGWSNKKLLKFISTMDTDHVNWISRFFDRWSTTDPTTGHPFLLSQAIDFARTTANGGINAASFGITVYGFPGLYWDY